MRNILRIFRTIFTYGIWLVTGFTIIPIIALVSLIPLANKYTNYLFYRLSIICARVYIWSAGIRYTVQGLEHMPVYPATPAIILINHASSLDIPLVMLCLKNYPHIWLSNDYSRVPFLGCILKRMHIIVDRSRRTHVLHTAYSAAKNGPVHLLIFPEGTRHDDGKIHEFFGGFAVLASQLARPIIPIYISNMHKIYAKKSYLIDSSAHQVTITIGKPIHYTEGASRQEFVENVRNWFVSKQHN